jgi:predicted kinase
VTYSATQKAPGVLIAMKGHPATGKSLVAEALARKLRWPLIDKDDVKDHILDVAGANERAYAVMWQIVATQLALGISAIAVSPLAYPEGYATAQQLVEQAHARLLVVETVLDEAEWQRRLNNRQPGYSTHKISGWEAMQAMLRQYDGCWQYPIAPEHLLRLDTNRPVDLLVRDVLTHLKTGKRTSS